ncbi:Diphthamide biosynthesis protein 3, variant 2 [Chamberlinius hualienensis]
MAVFYDEIEIEDFEYDEENEVYRYPCPCGDMFEISVEDLENGEEVATCPSCTLLLKVVYDIDTFQRKEKMAKKQQLEILLNRLKWDS